MLKQRDLGARLVVKRNHFVENREVTRFFDIGHGAEDEPAGVIIEAAADVVVAALGQWLILMIAAAVGELRRGDVDDALTGTLGDEVYKAHEVLVAVAESHAASDAALEERGRA